MTIDAPRAEQLPALRRLWKEAFGDTDEFLDAFEQTAFHSDRCRCATMNGETVAALYWFDCSFEGGRIAYLYAIATAKAHRGKGICRCLMEDTHGHLKELGYKGALLVPGSKELFGFYERLGYLTCSGIASFCCDTSDAPADIRELSIAEYAERRRDLLPRGGVVQEEESLRFLRSMNRLYTTSGAIFTARRETDTLHVAELLGDRAAAPAIVSALGCKKGIFRTVGEDIPFAMYRHLYDISSAPPSYFGLAFD